MQSYREQVDVLRRQLSKAREALASDVAAQVAGTHWQAFLRDRFDVQALVAQIDALGAQPNWVAELQVAGDRLRQQGRQPGRGRPRKQKNPPTGRPAPKSPPSGATVDAVS